MSKVVVTKEKLVAIGDALRDKTEATEAYSLDEMPEVIQGIETGGADFTISDASYLFCGGAKLDIMDILLNCISGLTNTSNMFKDCRELTSVDLSKIDTSQVTNMNGMFSNCSLIKSLDLKSFDTSNVKDMSSMFFGCNNLESVNLSSFNTSKVTTMTQMFYNTTKLLRLDMSNFDTSNVTSISYFCSCKKLEEFIGFSATNQAGMVLTYTFPIGTSASTSGRASLKRLTFRTDLPEGIYSIRSAFDIKYCSFDRDGMVEMFNTLPDVSSLTYSANYKKITITGNPCVTDGTLTEEDKAIATNKGWTLVI